MLTKLFTGIITGVATLLSPSLAVAVPITFTDNELSQGTSFTKSGLTVNSTATNGGAQSNYLDAPFIGLWYGMNTSSQGLYTLNFSKPVNRVEIQFDALSSTGGSPPETITNFKTANNSTPITYTDRGGTSFNGTSIVSTANDGRGIIEVKGPSFTSFSFEHLQNPSNNGFVIESLAVDPGINLFLDFNNAIPRDFYVTKSILTGNEYISDRSGSSPLAIINTSDRQQIISDVQSIFDRSGIAVSVTDQKPTEPALTVRFGQPIRDFDSDGDGASDARNLGQAYDITPSSWFGNGIDRFDLRKDGMVAVFMDTIKDTISSIVETVAHEAGHGYGARHINPHAGSGVAKRAANTNPVFQ